MEKKIKIQGKDVTISLSKAAENALLSRNKKLVAEMELYFSCLIRKQVRFKDKLEGNLINVTEQLAVSFRPVMTKTCDINYDGKEPPLTDFPIKNPASFIPHWLKIDFKHNQWIGEFGF